MMTPDRKKPGVAFYASVAVCLGLLYPIGWGPVNWLWPHLGRLRPPLTTLYTPILWIEDNGPWWIHNPLVWWANLTFPDAVPQILPNDP
jgi:hypothetical protein